MSAMFEYAGVAKLHKMGSLAERWRWAGFPPISRIGEYFADGYWEGTGKNYPRVPVCYQLWNRDELVYIGSTADMKRRMWQHWKDKEFTRWRAWKYETPGHPRHEEDRQLKSIKKLPRYNRKRCA